MAGTVRREAPLTQVKPARAGPFLKGHADINNEPKDINDNTIKII